MWLEFTTVTVFLCATLLLPGYFLARSFALSREWSICVAPVLSVSLLCIIGQILYFTHISAGALAIMTPAFIIPILAFIGTRKRINSYSFPPINWKLIVLYLIFGVVLGTYLFLHLLPAANSLFQAYDVKQHLNLIQAFADTGVYSSIGTSAYLSPVDQMIDPSPHIGFYPAAWHIMCALAVSATNADVTLVINSSMFVFCFLVYPLSMLVFLRAIFPHQNRILYFGSVVSLAFVAFPWALLTFGPIYPNVAGFAAVPAVMAMFVLLFQSRMNAIHRIRLATLLLLALIGLVLLHPNTLFTCAIILIPFCTYSIWRICTNRQIGSVRSFVACAGFVLLCMAIWYACFKLPFLQDTVTHIWPPYAGRRLQEIISILTQTYTMYFFFEFAAQIGLGVLVVIGVVKAFHQTSLRWIACSYLLICIVCIENAVRSDEFKQIIAGFWYTDPMRVAAVAVIAATPLAALGLWWVYESVATLVAAYNSKHKKLTHPNRIAGAVVILFLIVNFMPGFDFPGDHLKLTPEQQQQVKEGQEVPTSRHTTFGDYRTVFISAYTTEAPLSTQENIFLNEVEDLVPKSSLLVNDPMDGSFLAYGVDGLRVYYRDFVGLGGNNETKESRLIRQHLNEYATNTDVQVAVQSIDAQYVIVLSHVGSEVSFVNLRKDYNPAEFSGITSITNDTPGFTCIYQRDGMSLFEINR